MQAFTKPEDRSHVVRNTPVALKIEHVDYYAQWSQVLNLLDRECGSFGILGSAHWLMTYSRRSGALRLEWLVLILDCTYGYFKSEQNSVS